MSPGTFNVTLSGSSGYSIPIKIAAGSAGTQPQIQLNYDSQALGGSLGAGDSLGGLSVITRGPHDPFRRWRGSCQHLQRQQPTSIWMVDNHACLKVQRFRT